MLRSMLNRIQSEIESREQGDIPKNLKCDVCGHEILGDRYQFDESAFACNICYETDEQTRKYADQWEVQRTDQLCKELGYVRQLAAYYKNSDIARHEKHKTRCEEIERELERIGI